MDKSGKVSALGAYGLYDHKINKAIHITTYTQYKLNYCVL